MQEVRQRQAELLRNALAAIGGGGNGSSRHSRLMPYIFGSAEYLQDSQAGLGRSREPGGDVPTALETTPPGALVLACNRVQYEGIPLIKSDAISLCRPKSRVSLPIMTRLQRLGARCTRHKILRMLVSVGDFAQNAIRSQKGDSRKGDTASAADKLGYEEMPATVSI